MLSFRQIATRLLETAIRFAPPEVRGWGEAMRSELPYVEGGWAGFSWALGGTVVVAKHSVISLLVPGRRRSRVVTAGGLFAKRVSLRKAAIVASGTYLLGALLFFAAPPFRQGLQVSLGAWNSLFHATGQTDEQQLQALARRAEARQDPEGFVFVAARLTDAGESARLADKAVRLDPTLLWAYAVVAARHPGLPDVRRWLPKLEQWDPQNALLRLISAESLDTAHGGDVSTRPTRPSEAAASAHPAWRKAMAAAFALPRFDDYRQRLEELDQRVARRYGFDDPEMLLAGEAAPVPTYAFADAQRYADALLQSGVGMEATGNPEGAVEKFWTVANFGQVMDSQARTGYEHRAGETLQSMAYKRLEAFSGNPREAALFAYLGRKFASVAGQRQRPWVFGTYISRRNAAFLQLSSLTMLIFSAILALAVVRLIAGRRQGQRSQRSSPVMTVLALISAAGVLISSAALYLTYRPYWYIFQGAVLKGETSQTEDLRSFLMATHTLGLNAYARQLLKLPVYFWVTLLAVTGIILVLSRHFRPRTRPSEPQPDPRVPWD